MSRLKNIFDEQGKSIPLGKLLGRGGEGAVFEIVGDPKSAAKIYHPEKAKERKQKISAMVASGIQSTIQNAAFPTASLFDSSGSFAGFTMRRVGQQKPVHQLYSPTSRRNEFPSADYRLLVRASLNIARAVAAVHASGCVIGDLNHSGVLVGADATATLIDCDSFQFLAGARTFYCTVGVPDYTPPELQGRSLANTARTSNHDAFGLGVAIFSLLFLGRHPFSGRYTGRGEMPEDRAIKEYRFAYSADKYRTQTEPPPFAPVLSSIPKEMASAFERCFGPEGSTNGRPKPSDWILLLQSAEQQLVKCRVAGGHYYFSSAPECPWCKLEKSIPGYVTFPSPLNVNTATPLDLGQLIAAIRSVPEPSTLNPLLTEMPPVTAAPNPANKGVLDSSSAQFVLATLGGVASAISLRQDFVPPLLSLGALGASAYYALRGPQQPHSSQPRSHQIKRAWEQVERQYTTNGDSSRFSTAKRQSEVRINEFNSLPGEESRRMSELARKHREIQLSVFLERFQIINATIKGVASGRKATLRSYGIDTAADLVRGRIEAIPGFGPATTSLLLAWRGDLERRFVFNPNQPIAPSAIAKVKSEIAQRRNSLEAALKADLIALRTIVAEIQRSRVDQVQKAKAIWSELKQAEADESVRVFGDLSARRWVFGVLCFSAFIVAGAFSSPTPNRPVASVAHTNPPVKPPIIANPIPATKPAPWNAQIPQINPQIAPVVISQGTKPADAATPKASSALSMPPLDPPREIKPATQPPAETEANRHSVDMNEANLRLKELGFLGGSQTISTTPSALREFKVANRIPADENLDEVTIRKLKSVDAISRNQSFLGAWSVDQSCSQGAQLNVSLREARTEGGVCTFDSVASAQTGWIAKGYCQVESERWPVMINFSVAGRVLTWSSAKGRQPYYRCR